jgi:hypothetical protein
MVEMVAWELGIGAAKTAVSVLRSLPRLAGVTSAVIRAGEVLEKPAEMLSTGGAAADGGVQAATKLCFAAGTLVYTEDGLVPIEKVKVGDLVWSRDEASGEVSLRRVQETFVTADQRILESYSYRSPARPTC